MKKNASSSSPVSDADALPPARRVAIHEAGHCVVAHALGVPIHDVTIKPGETSDGASSPVRLLVAINPHLLRRALDEYCDCEDDNEDEREQEEFFLLVKNIQVTFGGLVAETLFFGDVDEKGCEADLQAISLCAERLCPPDREEYDESHVVPPPGVPLESVLRVARELVEKMPVQESERLSVWLRHRTLKLLRNRRDVVEAVATALLDKKRLSAAEVTTVIDGTLHRRLRVRRTVSAPTLQEGVRPQAAEQRPRGRRPQKDRR